MGSRAPSSEGDSTHAAAGFVFHVPFTSAAAAGLIAIRVRAASLRHQGTSPLFSAATLSGARHCSIKMELASPSLREYQSDAASISRVGWQVTFECSIQTKVQEKYDEETN